MKAWKDSSAKSGAETTAGAHDVPTGGNRCSSAHDSKDCERCGRRFPRPIGTSSSRWKVQRFCSKRCAASGERGPYLKSMPARFASKWVPDPSSGCWLWTALTRGGYGVFQVGRETLAHRVSYVIHTGPIPEGYEIDHLCRTPLCVNPDHLEAVTQRENLRREAACARMGLMRWPRGEEAPAARAPEPDRRPTPMLRGSRNGRAKLSAVQVREIRRRYEAEAISYAGLAAEYGVSDGTIGDILRRKIWRHIDD